MATPTGVRPRDHHREHVALPALTVQLPDPQFAVIEVAERRQPRPATFLTLGWERSLVQAGEQREIPFAQLHGSARYPGRGATRGRRGYVAWTIDPARRHGDVVILAVAATHRRDRIGTALCEHAFAAMAAQGVEVVTIGTGGTGSFHAPARSLYESLGCVPVHVAVYFKQL